MWNKIILEKMPSMSRTLTISKSGISFSSKFIKSHKLEHKEGIEFFEDTDNEYTLGFRFLDETGKPGTLALMVKKGSSGKSLKATELINKKKVLYKIRKDPFKENRMFEIKESREDKTMFYIDLAPIFENSISFSDVKNLSDDTTGIHRYLDENNSVIYIGKGQIKNRTKSPERDEWGIGTIEYSIIDDDNMMFEWEEHHIARFVNQNGRKPAFNVQMGNKKNNR